MSAGPAGHDHPVPGAQAPLAKAPLPRVEASVAAPPARPGATGVLADRMAAALVHREPGWRLPRRSALARRYNVSLTEIDAAISRPGPPVPGPAAAGRAALPGQPGRLLDPRRGHEPGSAPGSTRWGAASPARRRHVSRREAPQDVAWALAPAARSAPSGSSGASGCPQAIPPPSPRPTCTRRHADDGARRQPKPAGRRGGPGDRLAGLSVLRLGAQRRCRRRR